MQILAKNRLFFGPLIFRITVFFFYVVFSRLFLFFSPIIWSVQSVFFSQCALHLFSLLLSFFLFSTFLASPRTFFSPLSASLTSFQSWSASACSSSFLNLSPTPFLSNSSVQKLTNISDALFPQLLTKTMKQKIPLSGYFFL